MATYCVLTPRLRRCPTLLNPVPWQNWMAAYPGCTLQMKMLFRGWPVMVHDTHTRRRRRRSSSLVHCLKKCTKFVYHNKHGWPQRREENILLSKPTTDRRKASRGLSVTAALLVQVKTAGVLCNCADVCQIWSKILPELDLFGRTCWMEGLPEPEPKSDKSRSFLP